MLDRIEINRLEATPIEDVAARLGLHVTRHKSLCPWHDDSRPSLTFDTRKNRYMCYVCGEHGGVIDLVMKLRGCRFREAVEWLDGGSLDAGNVDHRTLDHRTSKKQTSYPPDVEWLLTLIRPRVLNIEAQRFLFAERHIAKWVAEWCGLSSIAWPCPCWRYGKAFYDAPSLLIPYYDRGGRLMSVQSRYLGQNDKPRFKFPRGSNCHIYGLQILRYVKPNEELWITEGCSDCWALLSAGKKAIAIPSATLLKEKDLEPLRGLNLHMAPDQDMPGEHLFLELRERLPQLVHHQLPSGYKDVGEWYAAMIQSGKLSEKG